MGARVRQNQRPHARTIFSIKGESHIAAHRESSQHAVFYPECIKERSDVVGQGFHQIRAFWHVRLAKATKIWCNGTEALAMCQCTDLVCPHRAVTGESMQEDEWAASPPFFIPNKDVIDLDAHGDTLPSWVR